MIKLYLYRALSIQPPKFIFIIKVICRCSGGNGVVLIEYKLGSFKSELGAKIASVTSGHNVTCFDYEVMVSPLFRWPDLVFHIWMPRVVQALS